MYGEKQTLYDVLRLPRDASRGDVVRTYRKLSAEMEKESSAPNPRRATLVREAYEVLSDPQKREAYDKSLRDPKFLGASDAAPSRSRWILLAAAIAVGLAAAWYFVLGRESGEPVRGAGKSLQEVQTAVSVAVGRVSRIEMSGARSALGTAVAVEEGVMLAPCQGIAPGVQVVVRIPPRDIPAQLRTADEASGLCKLSMSGGASWPLPMTGLAPNVGDRIYAVNLNAQGEAVVSAGEVRKVTPGAIGRIIESTARAGTPIDGAPLLDSDGRVVAIALKGQHTTLPATWIVDVPIVRSAPPAAPPEREAPAAEDAPRQAPEASADRRERLEKAFAPPPSVPKDL